MPEAENKVISEPEKNENKSEPSTPVVEKKTAEEAPKETQDQINWRQFRDQREKERKEKLALEQEAARKSQEIAALKAAMEAIVSKPEPMSTSQSSDVDETEEQRIQKQVKSTVDAALKEKEAREAQERAKREAQETPARLEQSFPDFNAICSTENLDYLEYHHPEVADAFKGQPDSFHKWANIYKAIKRYMPNAGTTNKDMAKADKNLSKPQSMSIPGMAATGDSAPRKMDDKARADNWQRMQKIMRGL